eukprot:tig00020710_g13324.t1
MEAPPAQIEDVPGSRREQEVQARGLQTRSASPSARSGPPVQRRRDRRQLQPQQVRLRIALPTCDRGRGRPRPGELDASPGQGAPASGAGARASDRFRFRLGSEELWLTSAAGTGANGPDRLCPRRLRSARSARVGCELCAGAAPVRSFPPGDGKRRSRLFSGRPGARVRAGAACFGAGCGAGAGASSSPAARRPRPPARPATAPTTRAGAPKPKTGSLGRSPQSKGAPTAAARRAPPPAGPPSEGPPPSPLERLPDELVARIVIALGPRDAWCRARLWAVSRRLSALLSRVVWPALDAGVQFPQAFGSSARAAALLRALRTGRLKCSRLLLDTTPFDERRIDRDSARERRKLDKVGCLPAEFWMALQDGPRLAALAGISGLESLEVRHGPIRFHWSRVLAWITPGGPLNAYPRAVLAGLVPLAATLQDLTLDCLTDPSGPLRPCEDRWDLFVDALRPFHALRRVRLGPLSFAEAGQGSPDIVPLPNIKALRLTTGEIDGPTIARTFPNLEELGLVCYSRLNKLCDLHPSFFEALAPLRLRRFELESAVWGWVRVGLMSGCCAALVKAVPGLQEILIGDWALGRDRTHEELSELRHLKHLTELDLRDPLRPHRLETQMAAVCALRSLRTLRLRIMPPGRRRENSNASPVVLRPAALPHLTELDVSVIRYRPPLDRQRDILEPDSTAAPIISQLGPFVLAQPSLAALSLLLESPGRGSTSSAEASESECQAAEALVRAVGPLLRSYRRTGLPLAGSLQPAFLTKAFLICFNAFGAAAAAAAASAAARAELAAVAECGPALRAVVEEGHAQAGLAAARRALPAAGWRLRTVPRRGY